ncbi:hypothetical protein [Enterococcus sp. DIV0876]|uniref:hypothetical protein n=1 Tax=Enterococcus sp. DIV0876 TaxID=2774633 RepID=UPI003D301392
MEIFVLDHDTIISEEFASVEEVLEQVGTAYEFINLQIDGEKKTIYKGVDY